MQKGGNNALEEYVSKTIGLTFKEKCSGQDLAKDLPLYLKGTFSFSSLEIDGQDFLLLTPLAEVDLSTLRTVNFANQISKKTGMPTLLQFMSMDNTRRRTLISHRENFVVPGKQIYIPSLRMFLNERGNSRLLVASEILSLPAQFLLLYHFCKKSLEGMPFKDIAEVLNYSRKTISIAISELHRLSICIVEKANERSKVLRFNVNGRELWNTVLPMMKTPVQKVWYIEKNNLPPCLPLFASYDTALAHYTFIAASSLPSVAIDKKVFSENQDIIQPFLHPEEGNMRFEVWKYDPASLARGQYIDELSLILCYKDTEDERVKKELVEMTNKRIW